MRLICNFIICFANTFTSLQYFQENKGFFGDVKLMYYAADVFDALQYLISNYIYFFAK